MIHVSSKSTMWDVYDLAIEYGQYEAHLHTWRTHRMYYDVRYVALGSIATNSPPISFEEEGTGSYLGTSSPSIPVVSTVTGPGSSGLFF